MPTHLWLSFVAVSALMGIVPGPGVTSIVGYALSSGRRTALAAVAGMAVGNMTAMTLAMAGVGALLSASATAFTILKYAGAAWLIGLGFFTLLKARGRAEQRDITPVSSRTAFFGTIAVGTFHPKTIVFFVAFVPQFVNPHGSYPAQVILLVLTFGLVVALTDTAYAFAASQAARALRTPAARLWTERTGGGVLMAAGAATAIR